MIRVDGELSVPIEQFDLEVRAGVNGTSVYKTGTRSDPIRFLSTVDVITWESGEQLYLDYTQIIGQRVEVVRNGITWKTVDFLVLSIRKLRLQNNLFAVGGLRNGIARLTCGWDMLPLEVEES